MKALVAFAVLSFGLVSSASALDLEVTNKSKTAVHHLYLSASSQKAWGPDQLGDATVEPGSKFTLKGIQAGKYDVKIVAAEGTECEVDDADFDGSMEWVITQPMLAKCE